MRHSPKLLEGRLRPRAFPPRPVLLKSLRLKPPREKQSPASAGLLSGRIYSMNLPVKMPQTKNSDTSAQATSCTRHARSLPGPRNAIPRANGKIGRREGRDRGGQYEAVRVGHGT